MGHDGSIGPFRVLQAVVVEFFLLSFSRMKEFVLARSRERGVGVANPGRDDNPMHDRKLDMLLTLINPQGPCADFNPISFPNSIALSRSLAAGAISSTTPALYNSGAVNRLARETSRRRLGEERSFVERRLEKKGGKGAPKSTCACEV